jgi:hypothetical protein
MTLSLKVLNRLRLGRDVAGRIKPSCSGNLAWVYVYPMLDQANGFMLKGHGGEERIVSTAAGNPIKSFFVRRLEIEPRIVEDFHQGIRDDIGNPAIDERMTVADENELEEVLNLWLVDDTNLHVPTGVGYEFELGPDLIDI